MAQPWTDRRLEDALGNLLRAGVLLSAVVVAIGGAIFLARHGHDIVNYGAFHGEPSEYRHIRGIIQETLAVRGRGIIQLGLLLLIATPIARVVFSVFGFIEEKDKQYVVYTLIVLGVLLYSLIWSS